MDLNKVVDVLFRVACVIVLVVSVAAFLLGLIGVQDYQTSQGQVSMIISSDSEQHYHNDQSLEFVGGILAALAISGLLIERR